MADQSICDAEELLLKRSVTFSELRDAIRGDASDATFENLLFNPDFAISQRGATFDSTTFQANNDGNYTFDRWVLLSDGNDIVDVSQDVANRPPRGKNAAKLEVETANKKFGLLQVLESDISAAFASQPVSLSLQAKIGGSNATLETIRVGILEWTGTADSVTLDVVSAWGVAGADPTLAANWAYLNTPSNITLSSSYLSISVENVTLGSGINNLAVFIWVDDTDATVDDQLFLGNLKLEANAVATAFTAPQTPTELQRCMRYFQLYNGGYVNVATSSSVWLNVRFPVDMRVPPTKYVPEEISLSDDHAVNYTSSGITVLSSSGNNMGGRTVLLGGFSGLTTVANGLSNTLSWIGGNNIWLDAEL